MKLLYRSVVFRPGRFFHTTKDVIESLEKEKNLDGKTDLEKELEGNPIIADPEKLPDKKLPTAAATMA
ncbi:unnamed protein product [Gongylonema pulchrum]|uniref:Ferredoxin n=1 Tax=Gongylonema pulchrum TaxID=637853 RepID=A0A183EET1_9BILA|nr:unnamed protein product [Gongylonema pulchrum]